MKHGETKAASSRVSIVMMLEGLIAAGYEVRISRRTEQNDGETYSVYVLTVADENGETISEDTGFMLEDAFADAWSNTPE